MVRKRSKRNRKKRVNGSVFPTHLAGVIIFGAMLAIGYIFLCTRCDGLGKEIKVLEKEYAQLNKKFMNEEYKWVSMKAPGNIEEALVRYGIEMTWPRRDQVVWLADIPVAVDVKSSAVRTSGTRVAEVSRGR